MSEILWNNTVSILHFVGTFLCQFAIRIVPKGHMQKFDSGKRQLGFVHADVFSEMLGLMMARD
ncbi:hypothetical protein IGS60_07750 [Janthinobacterium sp. FW305-128]|nr:hypothetical protein [Janthinobacterium sp. FW305-128]